MIYFSGGIEVGHPSYKKKSDLILFRVELGEQEWFCARFGLCPLADLHDQYILADLQNELP